MSEPARPFLKWAGGKRRLLPQILPHVPARFGGYHEPFVGSGALFFHLGPRRAVLSDNNERLIRAYQGLRDSPSDVIGLLSSYRHDRDFFEQMRERDIDAASDVEVAAWFIYLNKTGYNGLYRVNSKNRYNVPFGDYARPNFCDEETLRLCAGRLSKVRLQVCDFERAARRARAGDLVYFDPPYVPLSVTSYFTSYTKDGFDMDDQRRLRDVALALKEKEVHVLISNSSAPAVYELYGERFKIIEVTARRDINCQSGGRGRITELLIA
ncbi:MAG TPA: DNA adenine methylase [Polyangiaceae bacterium]|jgi:DNA adenine methylase|nr:DNA adenine methylase [Polyangiaceae bacterium]